MKKDYELLCDQITVEKVKNHFKYGIVTGEIIRYELPLIHSLLFVLHGALNGGVTTSLSLDATWEIAELCVLEMEIDR